MKGKLGIERFDSSVCLDLGEKWTLGYARKCEMQWYECRQGAGRGWVK